MTQNIRSYETNDSRIEIKEVIRDMAKHNEGFKILNFGLIVEHGNRLINHEKNIY